MQAGAWVYNTHVCTTCMIWWGDINQQSGEVRPLSIKSDPKINR